MCDARRQRPTWARSARPPASDPSQHRRQSTSSVVAQEMPYRAIEHLVVSRHRHGQIGSRPRPPPFGRRYLQCGRAAQRSRGALQEHRRLLLHHLVDRGSTATLKGEVHLTYGVGVEGVTRALGIPAKVSTANATRARRRGDRMTARCISLPSGARQHQVLDRSRLRGL
jgi:hypothetical protein